MFVLVLGLRVARDWAATCAAWGDARPRHIDAPDTREHAEVDVSGCRGEVGNEGGGLLDDGQRTSWAHWGWTQGLPRAVRVLYHYTVCPRR